MDNKKNQYSNYMPNATKLALSRDAQNVTRRTGTDVEVLKCYTSVTFSVQGNRQRTE